eukprot:TRINITY_DN22524_c0_g7_i1.p1 TRINITY_DN22524_c0_g7~~TRINITY_DN22524_c0_g7_i1.p1  ORF type:complete len:205 (-),score=14.40 TRINITY_DN22524_c0_g7_i1:433-1047(-)
MTPLLRWVKRRRFQYSWQMPNVKSPMAAVPFTLSNALQQASLRRVKPASCGTHPPWMRRNITACGTRLFCEGRKGRADKTTLFMDWLGRQASLFQTSELLPKFQTRAYALAKPNISVIASVLSYNTYAVSLLEYLAQLVVLPSDFLRVENAAVAKLLRTPYLALGTSLPFRLEEVGLRSLRSIRVLTSQPWQELQTGLCRDGYR